LEKGNESQYVSERKHFCLMLNKAESFIEMFSLMTTVAKGVKELFFGICCFRGGQEGESEYMQPKS